jgi:hypothetical protein
MIKLKHSKYKNTGILFELLTRQITSDFLSNKNSEAQKILKKYFNRNTELYKENKLYQIVFNTNSSSEHKAEKLIEAIIEYRSKLNNTNLRREKYNLIKEIKKSYNINDFFSAKINNYKLSASLYLLFEAELDSKTNKLDITPDQIIEPKFFIIESITNKNKDNENTGDPVLEEYKTYEPDLRLLTYKVIIEKFNQKYNNLSYEQKDVLKNYIENITNTSQLKEYYNTKVVEIKNIIKKYTTKVDEPALKIKINETLKHINVIDKNQTIKDSNIISLLQLYELISEIKSL